MRTDYERQDIRTRLDDRALIVKLNRPNRHNAITPEMYGQLHDLCVQAEQDDDIRLLVFRGTEEGTFSAGSDIEQFTELRTSRDGQKYEQMISRFLDRLSTLSKPTLAVIEGRCIGAGILLAAACDVRIASPNATFGLPVAHTLGNCLSVNSLSLLKERLGSAQTLSLLASGRIMVADEAAAMGFVIPIEEPHLLSRKVAQLHAQMVETAPLTIWSAKELLHRTRVAGLPSDYDVLERVYESSDFSQGVANFFSGGTNKWIGR